MLKRYLGNSKGVALVMVVAVLVILCTLGLAVLSISYSNLKVSKADRDAKLEFYMAESGIEQAYEVATVSIKKATEVANEKVNEKIKAFIDAERDYVLNGGTSAYVVEDNGAVTVNEEKLKELLTDPNKTKHKEWLKEYKKAYKEYLNNNLVTELKKNTNYKFIDGKKPDIFDVVTQNGGKLFSDFNDDEGKLTVRSKTLDTNSEKVETVFEIKIPDALPKTIFCYKEITKKDITTEGNPLWDYALVASSGSVIFDGWNGFENDDTMINGNVYANRLYFHNDSNQVTINGNLSTDKDVIHDNIKKGEDDYISRDSRLTLNGNIYTADLIIKKDCENDKFIINGNVFTSGGIEMRGTESIIEVNGGNWYTGDDKVKGTSSKVDATPVSLEGANKTLTTKEKEKFKKEKVDDYLALDKVAETGTAGTPDMEGREILCINKDRNKTVHLVGNNHCPRTIEGIKYDVKSGSVKGIIITAGNVEIHGDVKYTGLIISKGESIKFHHDKVDEFSDPDKNGRIKKITADKTYVKEKAAELELEGKNPFKNFVETDSVDIDSYNVGIGDLGALGDFASLAPYKDLIEIGEWQKL